MGQRYTQPQSGPAKIDKTRRLFDPSKISCVINPGVSSTVDALSGKIYSISSNPAVAITSQGKGINWVVNTNDYIEIDTDADNVLDTTSCSMLIATVRTGTGVSGYPAYGYNAGTTDCVGLYFPYTDNALYWDFGNDTTGRLSVDISAYLATGTVNIWGFYAGSRGREIWRNGILIASDASKTATRPATALAFRVGSATRTISQGAPAHSDSLFVLSKEGWSQNTFAKITSNPNLIFEQQRAILVPTAGGVSVNVSPTGVFSTSSIGSVTVSGAGNVTLTGVFSTGSVGSISATGVANVTLSGVSSTSSLGAISVTVGGAVNVNPTGQFSTSSLGTLTVTGVGNVSPTGVVSISSIGSVTVVTNTGSPVSVSLTGLSSTSLIGFSLVWGKLDDSQTAGWGNIDDSQTAGWTVIPT